LPTVHPLEYCWNSTDWSLCPSAFVEQGTFSEGGKDALCQLCPNGGAGYITNEGATTPAACVCLPGYGTGDSGSCGLCPANTFGPGGNKNQCEPCPDGTQSAPGATCKEECVPVKILCPAGTGKHSRMATYRVKPSHHGCAYCQLVLPRPSCSRSSQPCCGRICAVAACSAACQPGRTDKNVVAESAILPSGFFS